MRGRAGQGEVGEWSRRQYDDRESTIVTSLSSACHCCERDGVRGGAGQGQGQGAHEVGVTWGMWAVHVGSLRVGEGRAHRKGDVAVLSSPRRCWECAGEGRERASEGGAMCRSGRDGGQVRGRPYGRQGDRGKDEGGHACVRAPRARH